MTGAEAVAVVNAIGVAEPPAPARTQAECPKCLAQVACEVLEYAHGKQIITQTTFAQHAPCGRHVQHGYRDKSGAAPAPEGPKRDDQRKCANCCELFSVSSKHSPQRFCSRGCSSAAKGRVNPHKREVKKCAWCNSQFEPRNDQQKCCSKSCGGKLGHDKLPTPLPVEVAEPEPEPNAREKCPCGQPANAKGSDLCVECYGHVMAGKPRWHGSLKNEDGSFLDLHENPEAWEAYQNPEAWEAYQEHQRKPEPSEDCSECAELADLIKATQAREIQAKKDLAWATMQVQELQATLVEAEGLNKQLTAQNEEFRAALVTTQADYDKLLAQLKESQAEEHEAVSALDRIGLMVGFSEGSWTKQEVVDGVWKLARKRKRLDPETQPHETAAWLAKNFSRRLLNAAQRLTWDLEENHDRDGRPF